ncbi:Dyp-type peroxidase [Acinetobacter stercoris]|uniref:Putative deferrochelatase/peroxidase YfeX n=1 Tax=Acinetobacter stercoris TaxID=2126983 RepID=A0A2U3N4Y2_9GAMM|nr:Dyp-type peroxidase [Acinetobacter stercoris]SPL72629.1 putative deferrochelatase/peroxidase YfeX [Acinetobacter stercoris]
MTNTRIQPVISRPGENALFIVLGLKEGDSAVETVIDFAANFSALTRSLSNRFPQSNFNATLGFSSNAWDKLFVNQSKPSELETFQEIKGPKYTAVSTAGDLFFHIRADRQALCYELGSIIQEQLSNVTYPVDEVHGFRYFDGRAIIGFVDGTENPEPEIAAEYALVGDEDVEFKGGSYAFIQKYIHDMDKWRGLSDEEQEKVIGRKKFNDVELSDDVKPKTAHNVVSKAHDEQGNELKIMRANMPFSNPSKNEYGTFFIGYARKFSVTRQMLEHMFQGDAEGNLDRLLDFSTAKTGTLFFVPTVDFLDDLGDE